MVNDQPCSFSRIIPHVNPVRNQPCSISRVPHEGVVRMLLDAGVDAAMEDERDDTPEDIAQSDAHVDAQGIFKVILRKSIPT